jgi:hypothetical protein
MVAFMRLKIVVLAAITSAMVAITITENPGVRRSWRAECRTSIHDKGKPAPEGRPILLSGPAQRQWKTRGCGYCVQRGAATLTPCMISSRYARISSSHFALRLCCQTYFAAQNASDEIGMVGWR